MRKATLTLLLLILISSCGGPSMLTKKDIQEKYGYDFELNAKKYAEYGAVVIADNHHADIKLTTVLNHYEVLNKRIFERYIHYINSKAEKHTNYQTSIYLNYWKLNKIVVKTISPDGTVTELPEEKIKINTIIDENGNKVEEIEFSFPNVQENSVLYYYYELISGNHLLDFTYAVQQDLPIIASKFELTIPVLLYEWDQEYLAYYQNIEKIQPEVEKQVSGKQKIEQNFKLTYHLYNIDAFKKEKYTKPKSHQIQYIEFFSKDKRNKGWDNEIFGINAQKIFYKNELETGSNIDKFIKDKIGETSSLNEQVIDKVYQALQDNFEILPQRWYYRGKKEPRPVEDLIDEFYSDNKYKINVFDLNALAVSIFRKLGFKTKFALVKNLYSGPFFDHKIDRWELNHMLTLIEIYGKKFWLDFNEEYYGYLDVSVAFQGVNALILDDVNRKTSFLPVDVYDRSLNLKSVTINAALNEDLELNGEINLELKGNLSFYFRNKFNTASQKEKDDYMKTYLYDLIGTSEIDGYEVKPFDKIKKSQSIVIKFFKENLIQKIGNDYYLQPFIISESFFEGVDLDSREANIFFTYPWYDITKISIKYPKKFKVNHPTVKQRYSFDNAKYNYTLAHDSKSNKLDLIRILDINLREFSKYSFPNFKTFISNMNKTNDTKISIKVK
jgi:hypothetical protein